MKTPKLPLTDTERKALRQAKVKISELHLVEIIQLAVLLSVSEERSAYLRALAIFQQVPSIGEKFAKKLVEKMGLFSLEALKDKHPGELLDELEVKLGCWTDPCMEDQMRCVVHYASHSDSKKQWFDFTEERKQYRKNYGYPDTRPTIAWYD